MQTGVRNCTMNRTLLLIVIVLCLIVFGCTSTRAVKSTPPPLAQQNPTPVQSEIDSDNETDDSGEVEEQPSETIKEAQLPARELPLKNLLGEILTDNKTAADPSTQKISLNFDNADIYEVINSLSDLLGINYVIDSSVKGRVNIHTTTEIDRARLIPILETIFQMNNIALVKFGDIYKIIPIKEAKKEMMDITIGKKLPDAVSLDRVMIQVVPLDYIPSCDFTAPIIAYPSQNGNLTIHY